MLPDPETMLSMFSLSENYFQLMVLFPCSIHCMNVFQVNRTRSFKLMPGNFVELRINCSIRCDATRKM